ncbi:MAG TPA: HypC/HybG/HupF family hydrogenase formation chaperone [Chloroflexota bacterium]|nr:HypC/HybG/HupF family hydrogenase formation chaperone [Chloroflexota bacterium]
MCLALPGRIVSISGVEAQVVVGQTPRKAGLQLHPEACVGDYVLVKTGLVVQVLEAAEAQELMSFFDDLVAVLEEPSGGA